eukprot:TRINITY_DN6777_c0_g3_i2.p1 TRINITY_DN6777_c0_g3~~TRINITY_DN6777_c0_g3_i2.p1  ORF type:complete len:181 (-),score=34.12 TRINITY_DN6777_c0_g3_i2:126-620(-)
MLPPPPPPLLSKPVQRLPITGGNLLQGVKLKSVPKEEIKVTKPKGSSETITNLVPTVQHEYKGPLQVVLVITKSAWVCYEWLSNSITKVLFTTHSALKQIKEVQPEATNAYVHIETFNDLTTGLVEWKAVKINEIFHFTHVLAFAEEDLIRSARIRYSMLKFQV